MPRGTYEKWMYTLPMSLFGSTHVYFCWTIRGIIIANSIQSIIIIHPFPCNSLSVCLCVSKFFCDRANFNSSCTELIVIMRDQPGQYTPHTLALSVFTTLNGGLYSKISSAAAALRKYFPHALNVYYGTWSERIGTNDMGIETWKMCISYVLLRIYFHSDRRRHHRHRVV